MTLKRLRQILKALADDTRLRIIYLLNGEELTVSDICWVLKVNQPRVSKHLERLRLMKMVNDKRDGNFMYYSLSADSDIEKITRFLFMEFKDAETFQKDKKNLEVLRS